MTSFADETGKHGVNRCQDRPRTTGDLSGRQFRFNMQGKNRLRRPVCVEQAFIQHGLGPARTLFARLKHKAHTAVDPLAMLVQQMRGACQHGGMGIMSAGMHAALVS